MAAPVCPPGYSCTFHPPKVHHVFDPWWTGPWGIVVAGAAVVALAIVLITVAYYVKEARQARLTIEQNRAREREQVTREREDRQFKRDVEEQRTMQLDAAKGNPEMLKIVRDMQRESR